MTETLVWDQVPLKRLVRQASISSSPIKNTVSQEFSEGLFPGYSASGQDVWLTSEQATFDGAGIVVSAVGARCGKAFLAEGRWGVTANTAVVVPRPGNSAKYFWYLLNNENFWLKGQTAQPYVQMGPSLNLPVPSLPPATQRAIADYLDRETARIDTLIEEQGRLIEMLRERRQAVIDHEISERVEVPVVQLRGVVSRPIDAGVDEAGDSSNPAEWPRFVRTTDISGLTTLDPEKRVTVSPASAAQAPLRRNDLVATRAGATIGKTYIHLSDEDACYAGYLVRISPDTERIIPMYLAFWSQSRHYLDQVAVGAVKSTIENYSASKYRATRIPLPPLGEQQRIISYLDAQTAKIDALIAETETFIELSRERRSALITAAVTGQIDVRKVS